MTSSDLQESAPALERLTALLGTMKAETRAKEQGTLRAVLARLGTEYPSLDITDAIARLELTGVQSDYATGPYARHVEHALRAELASSSSPTRDLRHRQDRLRETCTTCNSVGHLLDEHGHSRGLCPDCLGATSQRVEELEGLLERSNR